MEKKRTHTKKLDIYAKICLIFDSCMAIIVFILFVCNQFAVIYLPAKLMTQITNIVLWGVGIVAILTCRKVIPPYFVLLYSIFLFFSHFLGSILDFYELPFLHMKLWWDKLLHTSFGYCICFIGLYVLCRIAKIEILKTVTIVLFILGFSALVALFWEIVEFTCDSLLNTAAQGKHILLPNGSTIIAVKDTMFDCIVHLCGSTLFILQYILYKVTKKSLLLGNLQIKFSKDRKE